MNLIIKSVNYSKVYIFEFMITKRYLALENMNTNKMAFCIIKRNTQNHVKLLYGDIVLSSSLSWVFCFIFCL